MDEKEFLELFRKLTPEEQDQIIDLLVNLLTKK